MTAEIEHHSAFESFKPAAFVTIVENAHVRLHRIHFAQFARIFKFERVFYHGIEAVDISQSERKLFLFDDIQQFVIFFDVAAAGLIEKNRNAFLGKLLSVIHFAVLSRFDNNCVEIGQCKRFFKRKSLCSHVSFFVFAGNKVAHAQNVERLGVMLHCSEICG